MESGQRATNLLFLRHQPFTNAAPTTAGGERTIAGNEAIRLPPRWRGYCRR
jgi:hypothetical protein